MEVELASFGRAALYMGIPFVLMIFYFQYKWAKTCDKNIQVLVAQQGGGGDFQLAPKVGGEITLYNPDTDETRTWPVNELATIDVTYPGVGFVPRWMQKTIRMAIVNEGDWEPMLNRSPHREKIASPDVLKFLKEIAENSGSTKIKDKIEVFVKDISTGPTREMIADPAVLGNLMRSSVMKALATVSTELTDALKGITTQLSRFKNMNPAFIYIGLALAVILTTITIYKVLPMAEQIDTASKQMETIHQTQVDLRNKVTVLQSAIAKIDTRIK